MIKKCPKCGKTREIDSFAKICWECRDEVAREKLAEDLKNEDTDTDSTFLEDQIFCPWCGSHYEPDLSDGLPEDDYTCSECGKQHRVTCDVTVRYSTERINSGGTERRKSCRGHRSLFNCYTQQVRQSRT